jgi:hypothetical protein
MEKVFGQRTPTAKRIHQCDLADHLYEVIEPAIPGVHAVDFLSDGGSCEIFRERWKTTARSDRGV